MCAFRRLRWFPTHTRWGTDLHQRLSPLWHNSSRVGWNPSPSARSQSCTASDVAVRQGSSTSRRRAVRRSRDDAGELRARKRKGRGTSEMKPFALGVSRNLRQSRYRVSVVEHIWACGLDRRRGRRELGAASRLTFASDLARVGCPPLPARSGRPPVAQRRAQRMHILRVTGVNTAGRVADAVSCFDDVPGGTDLVLRADRRSPKLPDRRTAELRRQLHRARGPSRVDMSVA